VKFKEIINRLTGISTPVFGVSWNPTEMEVTLARKVIAFLEDRRVLFVTYDLEIMEHCATSVIDIRKFLTEQIGKLPRGSELSQSLRAMRGACRKFLETTNPNGRPLSVNPNALASGHGVAFVSALGELRATFGVHLATIAGRYGLDIENHMATILPAQDAE
jgi:hypothetical protein